MNVALGYRERESRNGEASTDYISGLFIKETNNLATEVRKVIGTTTRNEVPIRYYGSIFEEATCIDQVILDTR